MRYGLVGDSEVIIIIVNIELECIEVIMLRCGVISYFLIPKNK